MEFEEIKRRCAEVGIPTPPEPVSSQDCCGDGCIPCILPKYNEDLRAWADQLDGIDLSDTKVYELIKLCLGNRRLRIGNCLI